MSVDHGSTRQRVEEALERVSALGVESTRIFIALDRDRARQDADLVDSRLAAGESLPLAGVLCSIKDLVDRSGEQTTAGSRLLRRKEASSMDATIVNRLEAAGAVIFGRTNLSEFAYSGVGLNPHHGTPGCIFDKTRVPGGSSCGAALSVAHGLCDVAIGTDTGGSVRVPAAVNGLYGIKPTADTIPKTGVHPLSSYMDSIGPLASDWSLACRTLDVLRDEPLGELTEAPLRIGVPQGVLTDELDASVAAAFERSLSQLREAGVELVDINLDWLPEIALANRTLISCEAMDQYGSDLKELESIGDVDVLARIRFSEDIDADTRAAAVELREASIERFRNALHDADITAIVSPTVPIDTPTIAEAKADFATCNVGMLRNTSLINFVDGCSVTLPTQSEGDHPGALMVSASSGEDIRLLACVNGLLEYLEG